MKSLIFLTLLLVLATVFSVCNAHETGVDISAWEKLNLEQALLFTKQQHAEHGAALETLKHHQKNAHIHHADAIKRIQHSKMTCSECELIIEVLQGIASSPSSINSTIAEIDALVCAKQNTTEKVKICGDLVSIVFKSILPMAFKAFTQLAWNIPQVVCAGMVKVCTVPCCADAPTVPQQLFLSFANSSNWYSSLSVTWVTQVLTPGATVRWGNAAGVSGSSPEIPTRTYSPFGGWVGQIHQAFITNLAPSTTYWYQVGSDQYGWSTNYSFTTMGTDIGSSTNPLRVLSIADVGWGPNSDDTIKSLTALLNNGGNKSFHVFQITGDVGYADFQQSAWDFFMNKFEPVFARVPTMFQIGNHESTWMNGTAYRFRLGMSQTPAGFGAASDALYFRQQIGTVHFVSLDTETAFDTADIDVPQQEWARQVLNTYPKSSSLPWTVVLHHRALYCYEHGVQCGLFADILRSQVEKIYNDKKVDLVVQGHLHTFALSWPTQNGVPTQKNYTNPTAPIYAIVGNPGNREGNDNCPNGDPKFPWLNEGYKTIGYTLLEFRSTGTQHAMKITGYESSTMQQLDQILVTKNL